MGVGERRRVACRRHRSRHGAAFERDLPGTGDHAGGDPVAHAVGARLVVTVLLVLTAGCGRGADAPATGPAAVRVTVSRDYGAVVLSVHTTPAGESALNGLRRVTRVGTSYAGRFVQSIDGL